MKLFLKRAFAAVIVLCFAFCLNPIHSWAADSVKGKPAKAPDWVGSKDQKPDQKDAKPGKKVPKVKNQ